MIDYGIQPSDMIVTQSLLITSFILINVMGTMTNRTTQALVPGSVRDIAFKAISGPYGMAIGTIIYGIYTTADILSVLEVAVDLDL